MGQRRLDARIMMIMSLSHHSGQGNCFHCCTAIWIA